MSPDDTDGTDTDWEWRVHPKGAHGAYGRMTRNPSVVITPAGSVRFNKATRQRITDSDESIDFEYVRYLVNDDARLVGFEPADDDDLNAYSISGSTASFQAVLSSFGIDKPDDSVMVELQTDDDAPAPYIDLDDITEADT